MFAINVDLMVVAMDTSVVTTMVIVAQKFEQCGDSKLNQPVPTETPPCPSPRRKYTQNTYTNTYKKQTIKHKYKVEPTTNQFRLRRLLALLPRGSTRKIQMQIKQYNSFMTRPKPAHGRQGQGLDWIVGPGYSFGVFSASCFAPPPLPSA